MHDGTAPDAPAPEASGASPTLGSREVRAQIARFVASKQDELLEIERRLDVDLQRLTEALETPAAENAEDQELRGDRLEAIERRLQAIRPDYEQWLHAVRTEQQGLLSSLDAWSRELEERRQTLIAAAEKIVRLKRRCRRLARRRTEELRFLATEKQRYQSWAQQLEASFDEVGAFRARTVAQRKHIAEELLERRAQMRRASDVQLLEQQQWLERERQRIEEQLELQLQARRQLEASLAELQERLDQQQSVIDALQDAPSGPGPEDWDRLQSELTVWQTQAQAAAARANAAEDAIEHLHAQLSQSPTSGDAELTGRVSDLERRLQLAMADLKAERQRCLQLEKQLAQQTGQTDNSSDWESQKRRLLAALEADEACNDAESIAQRESLAEAIRRTEVVVQEKDREIEELKQLLDNQSTHLGSMAVGAAAVAELLNTDDVVRQERENLQSLQDEWREKLRQAEVDISVERAKLARERAELMEKLRQYEAENRRISNQPTASKDKSGKPDRGRWLTRLGLGGDPG